MKVNFQSIRQNYSLLFRYEAAFLFCRWCSNLHLTFSDIDDCNSSKPLTPCDQICENIPGSYKCSCQEGFNLVNGSRCEGIVTILLTFLQMLSTTGCFKSLFRCVFSCSFNIYLNCPFKCKVYYFWLIFNLIIQIISNHNARLYT